MNLIKLSAISSTNSYLKDLSKEIQLDDMQIVWAENQPEGRGQMNTQWVSKVGESLTFSVFKKLQNEVNLAPEQINFIVSLSILESLKTFEIPKLSIKWPNDILTGSKKLCGILIENQWKNQKLSSSVIGIGLNVNESEFVDLPDATSMFLTTHKKFSRREVLETVATNIEKFFIEKSSLGFEELKKEYESQLFGRKKTHVFKKPSGEEFNGMIQGISDKGDLLVETENNGTQAFSLKEIKLILNN